jgi:hypothetical protein
VSEETGVKAKPLARVGSTEFEAKGEGVRADFYLMEFTGQADAIETRQQRWCTYKEALELLSFADARRLLEAATLLLGGTTDAP